MLSNERLAWNCKISHLPIKNVTSCIGWNTVTIEMNSSGRELSSPAWTFFQSTAGPRHSSKEPSDFVERRTAWFSRMKKACRFVSLLKFWHFSGLTWIFKYRILYRPTTCLKSLPVLGKLKYKSGQIPRFLLSALILYSWSWTLLMNFNCTPKILPAAQNTLKWRAGDVIIPGQELHLSRHQTFCIYYKACLLKMRTFNCLHYFF